MLVKTSFKDRSVPRAARKREGRAPDRWTVAQPGEYADVLQVIGQFFDEQEARLVEVVDQGSFLSTAWEAAADSTQQERHYRAFELDHLRERARARRTDGNGTRRLTTEEIFRALGEDCDRRGIEVRSICEAEDGFRVSGLVDGKLRDHTYTAGEVTRLIVKQRAGRRRESQENTITLVLIMR